MEDQIIVAVLDTGIWPESKSFSDEGFGPPPAKWKGICDVGNSYIPFKCNNKIIGARNYLPTDPVPENEELSPRDFAGHGTHVAGTIAGVPVRNVSIGGVGLGTLRGAVPRARIAVYKVCWLTACVGNSIAITDAIKDGVDFISVSNGYTGAVDYENSFDSYATFQAMKAGLFLSMSVGNNSTMDRYTAGNTHPWVITVGNSAGSGTDFVTYVTSGDGKRFEGGLLNTNESTKTMYPLVWIEDLEMTNTTEPREPGQCIPGIIKPESVKGKILLCATSVDSVDYWNFDQLGDCAGVITGGRPDDSRYFYAKEYIGYKPITRVPITVVRDADFRYLLKYYEESKSTGQPATASIDKTVAAPDTSPRSSVKSSRGPPLNDFNLIKPDVSAPGVNELDATTGDHPGYAFKTGTSMATPLLNGIAIYLKTLHPTWSAAAIKSALMTTSTPMTDPYHNEGPLAFGSGQISLRAADPGLVYDIGELDYVKYLCQFGNLSNELVHKITGDKSYDCAKLGIEKDWTLNYPSFGAAVTPNQPFVSVFQRTLTNVANSSTSNYKAIVSAPQGITVTVEPSVLSFTQVGQALSYTLSISGQFVKSDETDRTVLAGSIVWTDGSHQVKSPIAVYERPADVEEVFFKTHGVKPDWYKQPQQ
jgi:subtilisin family serine protease